VPRGNVAAALGAAILHKSDRKLKSPFETGHFAGFHGPIKPSSRKPSQTKLLKLIHKINRSGAAGSSMSALTKTTNDGKN
jgi:hypothetical protein